MESGEYYIGKANRPKWSELKHYQGSGVKFVNRFNKNADKFVRFYITSCETVEETELLESVLVDSELLSDEKCLNLVAGGGGITKHPSIAETSEKNVSNRKKAYRLNGILHRKLKQELASLGQLFSLAVILG